VTESNDDDVCLRQALHGRPLWEDCAMIDMAKFVLVVLLVTAMAHQRVLGEFDGRRNNQLCLGLTNYLT